MNSDNLITHPDIEAHNSSQFNRPKQLKVFEKMQNDNMPFKFSNKLVDESIINSETGHDIFMHEESKDEI